MFTNSYVKEVYELEHFHTSTKLLHVIVYAEYKKADLQKVMENQCQHLTTTQRNKLLRLLQIFEELFNRTRGNWRTDTVYFELQDKSKPI